jgi:transposase
VAFDFAKKKHAVAIAEGGRQGEVRFLGDVENSPLPIERTVKRLATRYDLLHVCFEAGPTGYGLYRQVTALGHDCLVVAPALIPKRAVACGSRRTVGMRLPWRVCTEPAN